jgi:CheY-like chemotaxis protein
VVHSSSAAKMVLAADDNPSNLRLLAAIIESQGYAFLGVESGPECLEMAARTAPSLIILDVEMPGMDGYETCRQLRARANSKHVPIAFYTAHRRKEDLRLGLAAGGNDFLLKPIEPAKLISRIARLTRNPPKAHPPAKAHGLPPGAILWV